MQIAHNEDRPRELDARKALQQQIIAQNEVLEAVALGKPLEEILHLAARLIERQLPGALASVLLTNDDQTQLFCGSAESLPKEYNAAIDGITIGEGVGSCGTAAFRRAAVVVTDTFNDPLWADFRDLAQSHNLRACWSHPISSQGGKLYGTFATYFRQPRQPRADELALLEAAARVAGIAIERKRSEKALRAGKAQLQTLFDEAPLGVYLIDADFRIRQVNPMALPVFGNIPDLIGRDFDEVIHILWPKAYADEIVQLFRHTLETGEPYITPERIEERLDRGVTEYYEWQINRIPLPDGCYGVVCYFRDISAQVFTHQAIAESRSQLEAELADIKLLQYLSAQMIHEENAKALYEKIMDAAVSIMRSEYATMQMFYAERGSGGELHLLAFRGFDPQAAKVWEWVRADSDCTCGAAFRTGRRVVVPDMETCDFMAGTEDLAAYLQAGIHAAQSTPLFSRSGKLVGMISTHWREPQIPRSAICACWTFWHAKRLTSSNVNRARKRCAGVRSVTAR